MIAFVGGNGGGFGMCTVFPALKDGSSPCMLGLCTCFSGKMAAVLLGLDRFCWAG